MQKYLNLDILEFYQKNIVIIMLNSNILFILNHL